MSKPVSSAKAPAANGKPVSRRGKAAISAAPTPVPEHQPIAEERADEDVVMKEDVGSKENGHANGNDDAKVSPAVPAKRGRVGALADGEKKLRRRSSMGVPMNLQIPQIPGMSLSTPGKQRLTCRTIQPSHSIVHLWYRRQWAIWARSGRAGRDSPAQASHLVGRFHANVAKPVLILRLEEQIEEGKLRRDGAEGSGGLETVACGGMHTLAIDEGGRVSTAL